MSGRAQLVRFLATDPADAGCAETFDRLDLYAELAFGGGAPERQLRGVAAHLRACDPCAEDLRGLIALLAESLSSSVG
jgi:hypothetical protein